MSRWIEPFRWRARRFVERSRATARWLTGILETASMPAADGRLTVAVDITPFWENLTGVGWYLYRLLEQMKDDEGLLLRFYGPTLFVDPNDPRAVVEIPRGSAIEVVEIEVPDNLLLPHGLVIRSLRKLQRLVVAAQGNAVLFAPNFLLPAKFDLASGAVVLTVHDLALRRFPWTLEEQTLRALERDLERNLERAQAVITVSEAVRGELVHDEGLEASAVTAIHHGPGHLNEAGAGRLPDGVPERYALHVGTIEPRKNLAVLVEAWQHLRARGTRLPLVLSGAKGWKNEDLHRALDELEEDGLLIRTGYVDDAALAALYRQARVVVCPSLYEGFGLPLAEALAMGAPALASDIPVFREVAGEAARFLPADDAEAWADAVCRLAEDEEERLRLSGLARSRAGHFDWRRAADSTVAVWRRAEARRGQR